MKLCLIVDDSSAIRKVAKCLLNSIGYEVQEAENGQLAIEQCQLRMPDAILLDWHMPVMDGQEFLAVFGRTFRGRKPYIVYATTEYDPTDISRSIAAGADDYILKPYDRASLEAKFLRLPQAA